MFFCVLLAVLTSTVVGQGDHLGLANGYLNFSTQNFDLELVHDAQLLVSLKASGSTFDFLPFDYLPLRAGNGQYHWGDVTFRYRSVGSTAWIEGDSSAARNAVTAEPVSSNDTFGTVLAVSNLANTLPSSTSTLSVTRQWLDVGGDLGLAFTLTNTAKTAVELGSLGLPAEFNNIFINYTAAQTQQYCSLSDPYIGMHAGYIRVSPISGNGAALVVTPLGDTPMEAYRNLYEPYYDSTTYGSVAFEGLYEWQTLTKAWAENEWNASQPWNVPSSKIIEAGASLTFGLRFSLANGGIKDIDTTVQAQGTPYARGVPGYIIPQDLTAQLLVRPGSAGDIVNITVDPVGSVNVSQASTGVLSVTPSNAAFGRVRLTLTYTSGQIQTVHYYIVKSGPNHLAALGSFLTNEQYYTNTSDPFGRAPSVISYNHAIMAPVLQDERVWIAGLSDEAGAGSFLAACMKQAAQPNADEIAKLEDFIDGVLFKTLQPDDGSHAVRKSVFYYGNPNYTYSTALDWTGWESWTKDKAYATNRAYDYVHVAASYWGLYRAGRAYEGLFTHHAWDWYLNQSYSTVMAAMSQDSYGTWLVKYATNGLMGETVFGEILTALNREGFADKASAFEAKMRARAEFWSTMGEPFGSELSWDSTGQEGVYYWSKYFAYNATAEKTLGTVLGFQPTVAHWGWNGNARRFWDNYYGSKLERIERQIHHYGSGLNALVALSAFRSDPTDQYLLRIGYGGMSGPLSNIHEDGFAATSFHSFPETLAWDAYSGDYGPNHVGLILGTGTYLTEDPDIGLVAYGGAVDSRGDGNVVVTPKDVARRKLFVGPLGLLVEIDAGVIENFTYTSGSTSLQVTLGQLDSVPKTNSTLMWLSREGGGVSYSVSGAKVTEARLGWQIPLSSDHVVVVVKIGS